MIDLKRLAEILERDEEGRRRIAKVLASEIAVDAKTRELLITAILRDVATKEDIENLRKNIKDDIENLKKELKDEIKETERRMKEYVNLRIADTENKLSERIKAIEDRLKLLTNFVLTTLIAILITLISVILKV